MVIRIPLNLVTHHQRIARVYKKWLRYLEGNAKNREDYLFKATLARCEFDVIYHEKDMRKSKQMIIDKENEFSTTFTSGPIVRADSIDGPAYDREPLLHDAILDYWHPLEKAIYPEYFARRELRKQQYIEMWEKMHGPPPPISEDSNEK